MKSFTQNEMSVIDMSEANRACDPRSGGFFSLYDLNLSVHGTTLTPGAGAIFACGYDFDSCFEYDANNDVWNPTGNTRQEDR